LILVKFPNHGYFYQLWSIYILYIYISSAIVSKITRQSNSSLLLEVEYVIINYSIQLLD